MTQVDDLESVVAAWRAGEPGAVVTAAQTYLERHAALDVVLKMLGDSLTALRRYDEAEAALDKALAIVRPDEAFRIHRSKGLLYQAQRRFDQAAHAFTQATSNAPDDASAYIYMGAMLADLGKHAEAEEWHRRGTLCKEGAIEEAWLNLALALRAQGRLRDAEACTERALSLDPKYEGATALLEQLRQDRSAQAGGLQHEAKKRMDEHDWFGAAAILERDVAENPSDPWSRMYLGSCHYELCDYDTALHHFRIAERLAPDDSTPVGLQGDVFHAMGERTKAGELYRRALAMNPHDELAQKNMAWWTSESAKRGFLE